ncbi:MAG: amino acid adenylation domain-containing protein [Vicinamibacterales bacterium]
MDNNARRATPRAEALSPAKRLLLERLTGSRQRGSAVAPSPVEQTLKAIWSRVLGCEDFEVEDNFFRVGGDSILAIRVRNLVLDALGVALEIQQLYDWPTIRELAPVIESLRAGGAAAPSIDHAEEGADRLDGVRLPAGVFDVYPMSEMQKAMAFHAELGRSERSYINHGEALIEGRWSLSAFSAACDALIRRHEILRTSFDFTSYQEPMQLVHGARRMTLPLVDLSMLAAGHSRALRKVRASMLGRPFRVDEYPLLRALCVKEGDTRHHLVHAHHHAILDGWSLNLLVRELWANYGAALQGIPVQTTAVRAAYRQFVRTERATVDSGESKAYWRALANGIPKSRFPVPVDKGDKTTNAAPSMSHATNSVSLALEPEVYRALKDIADAEGVHLATVLLTGHSACMGALHGQELVTTGRVVNGRPESVDGDLALGLFVNTCLHAVDLRGATWVDLLRRTAAEERASHPHRRYPISRMPEILGQGPPVETLFVFENYHMHAGAPVASGLRITGGDYATNEMKLVASFVWSPDRQHVDLTLYGLRGVVPRWMLRKTAGWYRRALQAFAASPQAAIHVDAIVTPAEIHQQTVEWNDTARPLPSRTLPADFERWAAMTPDAPGLIAGERALTYGELNRSANRLAHVLSRTLAGRERPVAILLEPGEAQVVAVVAIAKAGVAYVPLDVAYPPERLRYAIEAAGAQAIVTTSGFRDRFEPGAARVLELDRLQAALAAEPAGNPEIPISSDSPLYVIFTSGSTGAPKAVRLNHKGRANNFHDFIRRFHIGPGDRVLAVSNLTFDMSAFDILGALAAGAAVVAPTAQEKKDPHAWLRLIAAHRVTVWHSAPALARMLLDAVPEDGAGALGSVRLALLGGDWIPLGLPARLKRFVPHIETISLGGATEVSMDSTIYRIAGPGFPIPTIPYGRPMDNQTAFVLGPRLQPTPIGVAGELYLGGVGVGDGYVNRPELTASRFLPNPYPAVAGERVYKTGDQARYLCDGTLELLGRRDFQVKINGVRIELGEIEKTLLGFPGVEKAVVAAKAAADGQRRLVGYLVLERAMPPDREALVPDIRSFVRSRLPASCHPSWYVFLDALPLTPNGKVDRLALPDPTRETARGRVIVGPRGECERTVLEIWRAILRTGEIGVDDDFFEHGGDSVSATQIVSRLRVAFGADIPLALIFDHPTVAGQAERISALTSLSPEPAAAARAV